MPSLLGIDSGLTVTKAVLFDADGSQIAVARCRVQQILPCPRHVERDMRALWNATATAIREAIALSGRPASDITGIAATAHGDGIYLLDAQKQPLGHGILSLDSRAHAIADAWIEGPTADDMLRLTGQLPHASAPSSLLTWIKRHEPERFARIAHVLSCKDWLRFCLIGEVGTDRTEASTSFTNVAHQDFDPAALALYGIDEIVPCLPTVSASDTIVAGVSRAAAAATGLVEGTPVAAGLHDVTASALGIGGYAPGIAAVIAGTYSINETVSDRPEIGRNWFCRNGIAPGEWNNMAISPASTTNYDWFLDRLCAMELAGNAGDNIHAVLAGEIDAAFSRPSNVVFHPYLFGSPHGGAASAGFFGLNGWHSRGDMLRGVLEGIAFNHRIHIDDLKSRFPLHEARLTGGVSRNPAVAQLFCDVLDMPLTVTRTEEAAAWGAALCAGAAVGLFARYDDDPRRLTAEGSDTRYRPDPVRADVYRQRFALFQDIAAAMKPLWPRLAELDAG